MTVYGQGARSAAADMFERGLGRDAVARVAGIHPARQTVADGGSDCRAREAAHGRVAGKGERKDGNN